MHSSVRLARRLAVKGIRKYSVTSKEGIVGCGSNVVDRFYRLKAIPKLGEKGYFASPTTILETSVVGGVTLNHLSWAAQLGVPVSGLFLQGDDAAGNMIRDSMDELGVDRSRVQVDSEYTTAESFILLQGDGERSIIMASGATSQITDDVVTKNFEAAVKSARIMSSEISQVPLSGVSRLLSVAKDSGVLSVLDVDVQPSVAIAEAELGSLAELQECVLNADVLKPAKHAAVELIACLDPSVRTSVEGMNNLELAARLRDLTGAKLVALTSGKEGCSLATDDNEISVPSCAIASVTDATGAGDAFLGGLLAGLYYEGSVPSSTEGLIELANLANSTGAACCQTLGALPDDRGSNLVRSSLELFNSKYLTHLVEKNDAQGRHAPLGSFTSSFANDVSAAAAALESIDLVQASAFVSALRDCTGRVLVTGLGKSGVVAHRMAVSLASTGTPAHFVHASEWVHGDLGVCCPGDVVVAISHSGRTAECTQAATHFFARGVPLLSIVGKPGSPMENSSIATIQYSIPGGLEPVGGAPTASVVVQEMVVNAVVSELISQRRFSEGDFKFNHPGGSLGQLLKT